MNSCKLMDCALGKDVRPDKNKQHFIWERFRGFVNVPLRHPRGRTTEADCKACRRPTQRSNSRELGGTATHHFKPEIFLLDPVGESKKTTTCEHNASSPFTLKDHLGLTLPMDTDRTLLVELCVHSVFRCMFSGSLSTNRAVPPVIVRGSVAVKPIVQTLSLVFCAE